MADGGMVVIAGLTRNRQTQKVQGVPMLMDIPYFGALFRRTETTTQQRSLCIFITPRILATEEALAMEAQRSRQRLTEFSAKTRPEADDEMLRTWIDRSSTKQDGGSQ